MRHSPDNEARLLYPHVGPVLLVAGRPGAFCRSGGTDQEWGGAEWQRAALVPIFALFYVILAPWLGAFADARPKRNVMFFSNAIKVVAAS
jgi:hypothetical protein